MITDCIGMLLYYVFWVRSVYPPMGLVSHVTNFNQQKWTSFSLWCPLVIIGKHTSECANEWGALLNCTLGLLFLCFSLFLLFALFFWILFLCVFFFSFFWSCYFILGLLLRARGGESQEWLELWIFVFDIAWLIAFGILVLFFSWWLREEKMSPRHCQRGWRRRQHGRR